MYPYSNYSHQNDTRYFSNPQFPEPKKSSSWFGWLLIAIGSGLLGFLVGTKKAQKEELPPLSNDTTKDSSKVVEKVKEETKEEIKVIEDIPSQPTTPSKSPGQMRLEDLPEEIINKYVDEFDPDNYNLAEQLWYKQQLVNRPDLIKKYPKLAKFLGFTE